MKTVHSNEYIDIILDEDSKSQITYWKGGFVGDKIREGLDLGLTEFKKHPGWQWVGDTTNLGVIGEDNQNWINTDWFPRFLATGVKYMAVVVPSSVISKIAVKNIVQKIPGTALTSKYFDNQADALKWIKNPE